mgnify:CR=1 FL=1
MSDELEYSKKIAILDESDISLPDKANLEFVANQIAEDRKITRLNSSHT